MFNRPDLQGLVGPLEIINGKMVQKSKGTLGAHKIKSFRVHSGLVDQL